MKVFIIGASGLVGSHCLRYFKEKKIQAVGSHLNFPTPETFYFDPLDKRCQLSELSFMPDVIIHCGALTNVDYCEENEDASYKITVLSTEVVADYCRKNSIKLIYISTDYVFDGVDGPYDEKARTNPINIYGCHKLEAENIVRKLSGFLIVRITNVYGEEERSKNFIANLINLLSSNSAKSFNLPYDQFATPIYAGDIARMLYLLIQNNKHGIYNLSSTDYYNRYQLAHKVKSYYASNIELKLNPISTHELQQKAKRPLNGGLLNNKFSNEFPLFEFTNIDKFILDTYKNAV